MSATVLLLLLASDVGSVPNASRPNVVGVTAGLDGAPLTLRAMAGRVLTRFHRRRAFVSGAFDLPMAAAGGGDWRLRFGGRFDAVRWRGVALPVRLEASVRRLSNRSVRATGLGTELSAMPGWYAPRWFVAAEASWDHAWGVHLDHSDAYRAIVNEGVVDGWYRMPGWTLRYGARVGGLPLRWLEVWLRAGYEQHGRFDRLAPPVYGMLGLNVRLSRTARRTLRRPR